MRGEPVTAAEEYDRLITALPHGARIVVKRGWFWTALGWAVRLVTFGGNPDFVRRYATTLGPVIGVPVGWDQRPALSRLALLTHELEHVRQARWLGLGSPWLGVVPMAIAYLLLPLPFGLAWCRYALERQAYLEGIRVQMRHGADHAPLIEHAVEQLSGGAYGWAWVWPETIRSWLWRRIP